MSYPIINACPICNHSLHAIKLACSSCNTTIENNFTLSKFSLLSAEQMNFIEVFVVSRGNIKVVEKELGISYPTVRGKLNEIIALLGHEEEHEVEIERNKTEIITMLENNEISAEEAINLLTNK